VSEDRACLKQSEHATVPEVPVVASAFLKARASTLIRETSLARSTAIPEGRVLRFVSAGQGRVNPGESIPSFA